MEPLRDVGQLHPLRSVEGGGHALREPDEYWVNRNAFEAVQRALLLLVAEAGIPGLVGWAREGPPAPAHLRGAAGPPQERRRRADPFAPHPEVWAFFIFLYFPVAFIVLFGATLGCVQWASGEPARALWSVWVGVPVLALIHLASFVGSRLGQSQMRELKTQMEAVEEPVSPFTHPPGILSPSAWP